MRRARWCRQAEQMDHRETPRHARDQIADKAEPLTATVAPSRSRFRGSEKSSGRSSYEPNGNQKPQLPRTWTSARGNYPLNGLPGVERPCRHQTTITGITSYQL